jgi:NAD(P)-dependent dehydrogenase (short-subunit alcohol dehydrogenase family)
VPKTGLENASDRKAYIITGPTSGMGRCSALELAKHGTVVLVGRDDQKLHDMQKTIEQRGQHAISVVCDLSDPASVRGAAAEIIALNLQIADLQQREHLPIARHKERAGLGHDVRDASGARPAA